MATTLPIQPTTVQGPQSAPGPGATPPTTSSFSPHLEAATQKHNASDASKKAVPARKSAIKTDENDGKKDTAQSHIGEQVITDQDSAKVTGKSSHPEKSSEQKKPDSADNINTIRYSFSLQLQLTTTPGAATESEGKSYTTGNLNGNTLSFMKNETVRPLGLQMRTADNEEVAGSKLSANSGEQGSTPTPTLRTSLPDEPLLLKLQQIIDRSNETGKVIISTETNKGLSLDAQLSALGQNDWKNGLTVEKTNQTLHLRQNIEQQYFEAKLGFKESNGKQSEANPESFQESSQNSPQNSRQTGTGLVQNSIDTLPTQNSNVAPFSQTLLQSQEISSSIPVETLQPGQPSPTAVHDVQVIRQIAERFQILQKPTDTRINIRLHPAELGQLRIGLSVHDGTVRASVVAQSHMVHEILERNMPKLRSILEDQGLSVDNIDISTESDSVEEYTNFEEQLYRDRENNSSLADHHSPSHPFTGQQNLEELNTLSGVSLQA